MAKKVDISDVEKAIAKLASSIKKIEWTELLEELSSATGFSVSALDTDKVYAKIKEAFNETKEGKVYTYTPKYPNQSVRNACCLTCSNLLTCEDILSCKCEKYAKTELEGVSELTKEYSTKLEKVKGLVNDLVVLANELVLIETEQKIAEKATQKEPEEKPPISKRNKKIVELVKQGKTIEELAKELKLTDETVRKELEYLLKLGVLKQVTTENKITNAEVVLKHEGDKVIVLKPAQ